MLGKLRTECLDNYILAALTARLVSRDVDYFIAVITDICVTQRKKCLVYFPYIELNYKDIRRTVRLRKQDGIRLTSANAPAAGLADARRAEPPPAGRDLSALSRHPVLRPERSGTGEVREATQRREGRARCGGFSGVFSTLPALLTRHQSP